MSANVFVAGVGSTRFGLHPNRTLQSLAAEAARAALADSNIPADRIGCVFVGNFVGGIMTGQELLGPIVAADLGLSNVAAIKIEAACASSSAAVRIGHDLVRAGAEDAVLVIGVERLTGASRDALTTAMTAAIDQGTDGRAGLTFPAFGGMVMARHMHLYGTTREQVAAVTVKTGVLAQPIRWRNFKAGRARGGDCLTADLGPDPPLRLLPGDRWRSRSGAYQRGTRQEAQLAGGSRGRLGAGQRPGPHHRLR